MTVPDHRISMTRGPPMSTDDPPVLAVPLPPGLFSIGMAGIWLFPCTAPILGDRRPWNDR